MRNSACDSFDKVRMNARVSRLYSNIPSRAFPKILVDADIVNSRFFFTLLLLVSPSNEVWRLKLMSFISPTSYTAIIKGKKWKADKRSCIRLRNLFPFFLRKRDRISSSTNSRQNKLNRKKKRSRGKRWNGTQTSATIPFRGTRSASETSRLSADGFRIISKEREFSVMVLDTDTVRALYDADAAIVRVFLSSLWESSATTFADKNLISFTIWIDNGWYGYWWSKCIQEVRESKIQYT